jgi:hypothetical protein
MILIVLMISVCRPGRSKDQEHDQDHEQEQE